MRLVSAVLFVALTGSFALADEAKPADPKPEVTKKKVAYRVVKMLPETGQVLLFDRFHGTHVVAEVGQTLDGYVVQDIDEDEVTLVGDGGAQVILTAPAPKHEAKKVGKKAAEPVDPYADGDAPAAGSKTQASGTPANPYADGDGKAVAPVDPYAEPAPPKTPGDGGVRVAKAPAAGAPIVDSGAPAIADPYSDPGIAAFADAVGATPTPTAAAPSDKTAAKPGKPGKTGKPGKGGKTTPRTVSAKTGAAPDVGAALASAATGAGNGAVTTPDASSPAAPRAAATTAPAAATTAPGTAASSTAAGTTVIARSELDAALGDFGKLAGAFRATFTPDGLRFDALNEGTILTKIGLRKSDVITSVDGQPLKSLDDAASLYARAGTVRSTTIQVVRAGKPLTLRVAIQ